jgi:molecular chaperone DnaK (HSP70)
MVGGSCLLPYVREQLTTYLNTEPVADIIVNPLTVVSEGAALAAAALTGELEVAFSVINNHDLGTRTKDDSGRQLFSRVIPRGVTLPYRASRRYKPNANFEPRLSVQVWEGDADKPLEDADNVMLAELVMRPDKPRVRDESTFELEYRYDIDGILHVNARHLASGRVLLDDEIDFYTEGAGELDPEISDISGTFAPIDPQPAAPVAARARPAATAWRERHHQGPMFVVDGSNIACVGRDIKGGDRPSYAQLQSAEVVPVFVEVEVAVPRLMPASR